MRRVAVLALVAVRRLALLGVLLALVLRVGDVAAGEDRPPAPLEVVVAVDRTTSMSAVDDPAGSRMAAARADVATLGDALPAAEVALVTFGERAEVVLPPSTDRPALADELDALRPEQPTAGSGSALDRPVPLLGGILGGGATSGAAGTTGADDPRRVLVVLSDGEDTAPGPAGSWAALAGDVDAALVLGYGTPTGGRMPLEGGGLVTDPATGAPALSRRDDDALARVARELDGDYLPRTDADAEPGTETGTETGSRNALAAAATRLRGEAYADLDPAEPGREVAWLWGLALLALLLPELRLGWRRWTGAGHEARLARAARAGAS